MIVPSLVARGSDPDELASSVADQVVQAFGKPFRPAVVLVVNDIPVSRSGKIHRHAVRAWLTGTDPGDLSTVANLESKKSIIAARERLREYYERMQEADTINNAESESIQDAETP